MSKNFAAIYAGGSDASAMNQSFFIKKELIRGQMVAPTNTDFLYSLSGGGVNYSQSFIDSPHRTGRHRNNIVKEKTATEWTLPIYLNIKQGVAYSASIDVGVKVLWESALGRMVDTTTAYEFDTATDPSVTFTMFENLDVMAKQAVGCFVNGAEASLPGDGQSQLSFNGNSKTVYHAGIAKSLADNNAGNVITLEAGEAKRFDVGSMVMIVEADGITRSADTAVPRKITAKDEALDTITVDGAVLADADGSVTPIYVCYWEPAAPVGIDEPQTGLVGSITIDTLPSLSCVRSATVSLANNHELVNYCFGSDGLSGPLFVPGGRAEIGISLEMNLNSAMVEFMKRIRDFEGHSITLIVGDAAARHFKIELPKVIFQVPAISVPENGSIPVSFEGNALQSSLGAADEITVSYA
jgi:hypothetical protein